MRRAPRCQPPPPTELCCSFLACPSHLCSALPCAQVAALSINWEQQRKADEELCRQLLHQAGGPLRACARGAGWCSTPKVPSSHHNTLRLSLPDRSWWTSCPRA